MEEKSGMWRTRGGGAGERVQRERGRASEQKRKREQRAGERERGEERVRGTRGERERRERYFFWKKEPSQVLVGGSGEGCRSGRGIPLHP